MLAYRIALTLAAPIAALALLPRLLRGRERLPDLAQRLGAGNCAGRGRMLWVHGASVGELTAARALVTTLLERHPDLVVVATANTPTGRRTLDGWGHPRLCARLAPLDYRICTGRFLARYRPLGLLLLENELWPNRMALLRRRGLPVAMVAARLSARSAERWGLVPGLARQMLSGVGLLSAQSEESAARFAELGLPPEARAPALMLKAEVAATAPDPVQLQALAAQFVREDTLLAASTHPGEEAQVIAAFVQARATRPGLRLILAPRHPERGAEVSALLRAAGLGHARRGAGALPDPADPVYLADTLGEMALWYTLAGTCLVGGSLVAKGGHTPWEPARAGCAILHGPSFENFAEPYAALDKAQAAVTVMDAPGLAAALAGMTPARRRDLAERARAALDPDGAEAARLALVARIEQALGLPADGGDATR